MWHLQGPAGEWQGENTWHIFICTVERVVSEEEEQGSYSYCLRHFAEAAECLPRATQARSGAKENMLGCWWVSSWRSVHGRQNWDQDLQLKAQKGQHYQWKLGWCSWKDWFFRRLESFKAGLKSVQVSAVHWNVWSSSWLYMLQNAWLQETRSWHQQTIAIHKGTAGISG